LGRFYSWAWCGAHNLIYGHQLGLTIKSNDFLFTLKGFFVVVVEGQAFSKTSGQKGIREIQVQSKRFPLKN